MFCRLALIKLKQQAPSAIIRMYCSQPHPDPQSVMTSSDIAMTMSNGLTGRIFPKAHQRILHMAALAQGYQSTLWVSKHQLSLFNPPVQLKEGEVGTKLPGELPYTVYNAEQSTNPAVVCPQHKDLETVDKFMKTFSEKRKKNHIPRVLIDRYRQQFNTKERIAREASVEKRHKKYLVVDLETTTTKLHKRVASPFCESNRVVLPGYLNYRGELIIPPRKLEDREDMRLPPLDDYDVLVGHNLKFDLLYLWRDPELKKFLRRGGRIWDTLYAEYLLTGQRVRLGYGAGLDDVCVRYGGTQKLDAVKELWDRGVDTRDIDYALLAEYLEGDLRNTQKVFLGQLQAAVRYSQAAIIEARNDIVLCTTEMEYNGLRLDAAQAAKLCNELRKKIVATKKSLLNHLPPMPVYMRQHFNWQSTGILTALYFGGTLDFSLLCPNDVKASVELCMMNEDAKWGAKFSPEYVKPYLRARGITIAGNTDVIRQRLKSYLDRERCFDYGLILAAKEGDSIVFYDPRSGKRCSATSLPQGVGLKDALGVTDENVVVMSPTWIEPEVRHALLEEAAIMLPYESYFFAHVGPLFAKEASERKKQNENGTGMTKERLEQMSSEALWDAFVRMCGGGDPLTVCNAVLRTVGSLVCTKYDCLVPEQSDLPPPVELTGIVNALFENPDEAELYKKKHLTATGRYSVSSDIIDLMASKGCEMSKLLGQLRQDSKLLGTYFETDGTGMMSLLNEKDSCIHHTLSVCQTVTSRMASGNPNCQNIPKDEGMRSVFVSRFEDGVCLEADYSQLEVIVLCALSRDANMISDLRRNIDFHCKRVTMMRPDVSYEDVVQKAKKQKDPEWVALRQRAKIFSFQRQYGAGIATISSSTGLTREDVKSLIAAEERAYPDVAKFHRIVQRVVETHPPPMLDAGKPPSTPQGEFRILTGTRFTFSQVERPIQMGGGLNFLQTQLMNYPVQGFAGEIVQVMLGKLFRRFVETENYGGRALLTNTVHDCVWIDCQREVAKEVAADVEKILTGVRDVFSVLAPELQVELDFPVEVVGGKTMASMKSLH